MRKQLTRQLNVLNVDLITMGALCEDAITTVTKCLVDNCQEELLQVRQYYEEINHLEKDIEGMALKLFVREQPVARDLRIISAAFKIVEDMKRIGTQAADIAEIVKEIDHKIDQNPARFTIGEMAERTSAMVVRSVDSYVRQDEDLANKVIASDDTVDDLFIKVKNELIKTLKTEDNQEEISIQLLMIAKYLERIGDHAANIAHWVLFALNGGN